MRDTSRSSDDSRASSSVGIDGLDQVAVEARLLRKLPVDVAAPAGERDQHHVRRRAHRGGSRARPRSRRASACRGPSARRRAGRWRLAAMAPSPSNAVSTSLPSRRSIIASVSAASRLSSTTRMRREVAARRAVAAATTGCGASALAATASAAARRTRCPGRGRRCALRRCPPCSSTSCRTSARPSPRPPCAIVGWRLPW